MIATAPALTWTADEIFAQAVSRGFVTAAQAAEAGHPVTLEERDARRVRWESSSDPDIRAAFEAGRLTGIDEYDRGLVDALSFALGGPQATSIRNGADRCAKAVKRQERRAAFDRSDPTVLAEHAREAAADRQRQVERDRRALEVGLATKPIGGGEPGSQQNILGWREMRRYLSDEVWASVWRSGLGPQTRAQLANLAPKEDPIIGVKGHRHLRSVAA